MRFSLNVVRNIYINICIYTGCLRNYRKAILQLRTSVLGRLRDLQYIFAVIYEICNNLYPGMSK